MNGRGNDGRCVPLVALALRSCVPPLSSPLSSTGRAVFGVDRSAAGADTAGATVAGRFADAPATVAVSDAVVRSFESRCCCELVSYTEGMCVPFPARAAPNPLPVSVADAAGVVGAASLAMVPASMCAVSAAYFGLTRM